MTAFTYRLRGGAEPITVADYRARARRRLPGMVWAFVDGGAEAERTLSDNTAAFDRYRLRPRVLTGAAEPDLRTVVDGVELALPVFLSPTGMSGLVHWSGESAAARAAERAGTRAVISTAASYTVEEIAAATGKDHFFQLYPWMTEVDGRPLARTLVERAARTGFRGLTVTVDVPVAGNRERERRHGMGVPPTLTPVRALDAARRVRWAYGLLRHQRISSRMLDQARGAAAAVRSARTQQTLMSADLAWDDLARVRDWWSGPLTVKGIVDPDDADRAVALGADAITVSNHGGRQLDGAPAALDALPGVVAAVGDRVPVHLDGGIRRGTDVVTALALGARAVGIGRPYLYGLAVGGEDGVVGVLEILRTEIARTLTLMGKRSVADLNPADLITAP